MTIEILKAMAKENQVFSFDQLYQKTHIKKEMLKVILFRMEEKGFIERIEKGKYLIIPLGSEKGKYTLHEFIIASYLVKPYALSYWSALHHYGFTEQIPSTVFVQTTARKKKSRMEIFGANYQIVRVKEDKFFGVRKEWIEDTRVSVTDKEKTIIDCLDKPHYAGGIIEIAKASGIVRLLTISSGNTLSNSTTLPWSGGSVICARRWAYPLISRHPVRINICCWIPRCPQKGQTILNGGS